MADPDLQIRGGAVSKNFFWSFGPQFGLKIRGAGPPGPSPRSATVIVLLYNISSIIFSLNIVYCSYKETGRLVNVIVSFKFLSMSCMGSFQ